MSGRGNLSVVARNQVTSLIFDGGRVTGVSYRRGHEHNSANVSAGFILGADAIGSPQIALWLPEYLNSTP